MKITGSNLLIVQLGQKVYLGYHYHIGSIYPDKAMTGA